MNTQEKNILNYLEYIKIYKQKYLTLKGLYKIGYPRKYKIFLRIRIGVITSHVFHFNDVEGRLNAILKEIRDFKEMRTLQDISLRKLLKKKLVGELSEDEEAELDYIVNNGIDVNRLTFDTLDLLNVLGYNLIFPQWYSDRFCYKCHSDQVVGYTREQGYKWCFDCFTSELSRYEEKYADYRTWRDWSFEDDDDFKSFCERNNYDEEEWNALEELF